jgi:hypothetical protein
MNGKLYQLLGDNTEELYYTEDKEMTIEKVEALYKEWKEADLNEEDADIEFDDWIEEFKPEVDLTRVFVNEIYV